MNGPLYTVEILRLAASLPDWRPLERRDGLASKRSPTCGSTIETSVQLADGRIEALAQRVSACAFGQASAALVALQAPGHDRHHVQQALDAVSDWLSGAREDPGDWPGFEALAPARNRSGRHGAIILPLQSLLAALDAAE